MRTDNGIMGEPGLGEGSGGCQCLKRERRGGGCRVRQGRAYTLQNGTCEIKHTPFYSQFWLVRMFESEGFNLHQDLRELSLVLFCNLVLKKTFLGNAN
jgi:hypothetical protein